MSSSRFQGFVLPSGRVNTQQTPAGVIPSGALMFRGIRITPDGKFVISPDTGQQILISQGIAIEAATGITMYSSGPVANITKGGLAVDAKGVVVMVPQDPNVIHQGVGLTDDGQLCVSELGCFFVVSVVLGVPSADNWTVCFNETPNQTTCLTADFVFRNLDNPNAQASSTAPGFPGPNCLDYPYGPSTEFNGNGPLDTLRMDYTPGTCNKQGDASPECLLAAISDYEVDNQIWGPINTRIGDLADNIVVAEFPTAPQFIGTRWLIYYNGVQQTISSSQIVGNSIQFTMAAPVAAGVPVTISHDALAGYPSATSCYSVDQRICWRFRNMPVDNIVGLNFWRREDGGQWKTDAGGNWILEN